MLNKPIQYLALGDSYTIGEQVLLQESFPYQLVQLARRKGLAVSAPEIIARTGWTTDELLQAISTHIFSPVYDWVSLLIGVNNQYRGWTTEHYEKEFTLLLKQAISFAGGDASRVVVLSIPDWGVTPFAEGRNRELIRTEIDNFNTINQQLALKQAVGYINITPGTREASNDPGLLASDGLHPSAREYRRWAEAVLAYLSQKGGGSMPSALR